MGEIQASAGRVIVREKIKQGSLIICLFLFLFVVIGSGLHLNPGGAFLAAATGTPLLIYFFNRRWPLRVEHDPVPSSRSPGFARTVAESQVRYPRASETDGAVQQ
jgi:O-antigen/teichoic acid export membrane protein